MLKTPIGLVDDHQLFISSLSLLLENFGGYEVVLEALNGKILQTKLSTATIIPEVLLIDVNMPEMDGVETARWVGANFPTIKTVALTMNDKDATVIAMLRAGCCAYLLKDTHPVQMQTALTEIVNKGYYNADAANINFRRLLTVAENEINLTIKEQAFLEYACSELTYKEIAARMQLSERTIDGYRETLFHKLQVHSRVGLCLKALKKGYVNL